jgi:hypothetical protein
MPCDTENVRPQPNGYEQLDLVKSGVVRVEFGVSRGLEPALEVGRSGCYFRTVTRTGKSNGGVFDWQTLAGRASI